MTSPPTVVERRRELIFERRIVICLRTTKVGLYIICNCKTRRSADVLT